MTQPSNSSAENTIHQQRASTQQVPLTQWLRAASLGDNAAAGRAYALVYDELRALAARQAGQAQLTLTPTALVHETFLKLSGDALMQLNDRQHFFNLAARAMRQTVVSYARERLALKRGGGLLCSQLDDAMPERTFDAEQALALDQALEALDQQDADLAVVLNLRVFAGLSTLQIAELRGVTERKVQRDLTLAKNYLRMVLT